MFGFQILGLLPVLIVLVGLFRLRGRAGRALSGSSLDGVLLTWCVVALLVKQALFMNQAHLEWRATAAWGIVCGAIAPVAFLLLVPSTRWRALLAWLTVAAAALLLFVDSLYHAWFGDMFPWVASLALGQVSALLGGIRPLLSAAHGWVFLDSLLAIPLVMAAWRRPPAPRPWRRVIVVGVAVAVAAVSGWWATAPVRTDATLVSQRFSNLALVEAIGPLPFHVLDSGLLVRRAMSRRLVPDERFDEILGWLRDRAPQRAGTGPWFGVAAGKNLIVIQVESLQAQIVDLQVHGQPVMPNLRRLAAAHWSFTHVVDQTDEGRTSDAEWMMLTSQLPEGQGAAAFANAGNHLVGLPSVLAARGYHSVSAVPFSPSFWNRRSMHQNFGFFQTYFESDFAPGERIGWGLNDRDFLQQMVPRLAPLREPFVAWLITLSMHYPFESFPDRLKQLRLGEWEGTPFGNYLHGMRFFDRALGEFVAALEREGLLDRSVLVVTGDHSAGFEWSPEVAHALGFSNTLSHWTLAERMPMVIRIPGAPPLRIDRAVGQVDFAPTMLGLLGVDAAVLPYVGRNSLGNPGDEPIVRRKGGWIADAHFFLRRGPTTGSHCFDRQTLQDAPLSACEADMAVAARKALSPRGISDFDLQQRLHARLVAEVVAR